MRRADRYRKIVHERWGEEMGMCKNPLLFTPPELGVMLASAAPEILASVKHLRLFENG